MFSFQRLKVYQKARLYNQLVRPFIAQVQRRDRAHADQLRRAGGSIQHNIAEGAAKDQPKSKAYFYRVAKGSAEECAAAWERAIDQGYIRAEDLIEPMKLLEEIAAMLASLIMRFDPGARGRHTNPPKPPPDSDQPNSHPP